MKRVALATHSGCPHLTEDDRLLIPALRDLGIEARPVVWDEENVGWREFDQVIVRSCWDYHLRLPEFLAWITNLESQHVELQNSALLVRWNADKRYLRQVEELGVTIPETCWLNEGEEHSLRTITQAWGWERAVVKPIISATAYKTRRICLQETDEAVQGPLMVQQFLPEIQEEGEWSLVFIGGDYSHAVRKYPAAGDFRVQTQFGGRVGAATPNSQLVDAAGEIMDKIAEPALYARVDGLEREGKFVLMELELIEPVLFLAVGGAADRFAQAISKTLNSTVPSGGKE